MAIAQSMESTAGFKADLVLEGGGVKGIGLLGAATTLASHGYTFPRVAGTSAGAIAGALIAASLTTGASLDRLIPIMAELDYTQFRDATALDHLGRLGEGVELVFGRGIYKGDFLVSWLEGQLRQLGVDTFGDLRISDEDDPNTSLASDQRYRLVVMASDISTGQLVRLPWDCRNHYHLDPDRLRIVDAVRASMSIPFFFKPAALRRGDGGTVTLVDGGMLSNFPIDCFDRTDGHPSRWPTFGVKLSSRPGAVQVPRSTGNSFELAMACLHTLMGAHDAYHLNDEHVTERTIFVDCFGVTATQFDIDRATQQKLLDSGRQAAATFISNWPPKDFTAEGDWKGPSAG